MRWLFHLCRDADLSWGKDGRYAPSSLAKDGFIHASFKDAVLESARLYFSPADKLRVLKIDPRRVDVPILVEETPRGPMPHVYGSIPCDAVKIGDLDAVDDHADKVTGTKIGFIAFAGMTLLDLVGPLDALSRIASMGFDGTTTCEVIALTKPPDDATVVDVVAWTGAGATLRAARYRPALDAFDLLVIPGGHGTADLEDDEEALAYIRSFPENRMIASVCTGALVLGAAGRLKGKRATTHHRFLESLTRHGAQVARERVVDEGQIVTAGGVTAGIDLGIHLVHRLAGADAATTIAQQMEHAFTPKRAVRRGGRAPIGG
jgi:putative intracellular protease/amidase/uncharacterized protein (DUF952 family)